MSAELTGILSVGVALLWLGLRLSARLDDVGRELARVASLLEALGLSGLVPDTPASGDLGAAERRFTCGAVPAVAQ